MFPNPTIRFAVGDHAVFPGQGIGKITALEEKLVKGEKKVYLVFFAEDRKLLISAEDPIGEGLRKPIDKTEIGEIFKTLRARDPKYETIQEWTLHLQELCRKRKQKLPLTTSPLPIAETLRVIRRFESLFRTTIGEQNIFQHALDELAGELAFVQKKSVRKVKREILACLPS